MPIDFTPINPMANYDWNAPEKARSNALKEQSNQMENAIRAMEIGKLQRDQERERAQNAISSAYGGSGEIPPEAQADYENYKSDPMISKMIATAGEPYFKGKFMEIYNAPQNTKARADKSERDSQARIGKVYRKSIVPGTPEKSQAEANAPAMATPGRQGPLLPGTPASAPKVPSLYEFTKTPQFRELLETDFLKAVELMKTAQAEHKEAEKEAFEEKKRPLELAKLKREAGKPNENLTKEQIVRGALMEENGGREPTYKELEKGILKYDKETQENKKEPSAYTGQAKEMDYQNYKLGKAPIFAWGNAGAADRNAFKEYLATRSKEEGLSSADLLTQAKTFDAKSKSLSTLVKDRDLITRAESQANKMLDLTEAANAEYIRSAYKTPNKFIAAWKGEISDPKFKDFKTKILAAGREYMKITTGSALSVSELTHGAQQTIDELFSSVDSVDGVKAVIDAMRQEITATGKSWDDVISERTQSMKGGATTTSSQGKSSGPPTGISPAMWDAAVKTLGSNPSERDKKEFKAHFHKLPEGMAE